MKRAGGPAPSRPRDRPDYRAGRFSGGIVLLVVAGSAGSGTPWSGPSVPVSGVQRNTWCRRGAERPGAVGGPARHRTIEFVTKRTGSGPGATGGRQRRGGGSPGWCSPSRWLIATSSRTAPRSRHYLIKPLRHGDCTRGQAIGAQADGEQRRLRRQSTARSRRSMRSYRRRPVDPAGSAGVAAGDDRFRGRLHPDRGCDRRRDRRGTGGAGHQRPGDGADRRRGGGAGQPARGQPAGPDRARQVAATARAGHPARPGRRHHPRRHRRHLPGSAVRGGRLGGRQGVARSGCRRNRALAAETDSPPPKSGAASRRVVRRARRRDTRTRFAHGSSNRSSFSSRAKATPREARRSVSAPSSSVVGTWIDTSPSPSAGVRVPAPGRLPGVHAEVVVVAAGADEQRLGAVSMVVSKPTVST